MARWRYYNSSKQSRAIPRIEPRIAVLSALIAVVMSVVTVRLYYLQIIRHKEFVVLADRNRIRIHRQPALRGLVFDVHHRPLVDTRPSFDAVMVPEDVRNVKQTVARLEGLLGQDNIAAKLNQAEDDGRPPFDPVTVEEHLGWQQVVSLETHQLQLPGVSLEVMPERHYIYGGLAAHLLGYVGEVAEADLRRSASDYRMGDEIGKFGLERVFESQLRGQAGGQEIEVDSVGRRLKLLREIPEIPGESVVLSLDLDLQQAAEKAMGNWSGALVAVDPNTGYILAMVSHPTFDPNIFANGINAVQWRGLTTDPAHPLANRAIAGTYPPGSTFKLIDAIAAMEEHTLTPETSYYCPGGLYYGNREYHCWRKQGHGTLSVHRAIVGSCDVFFYQVGIHLGIDRLAHWARLLGLGEKTGVDLENERAGVMPSSLWKEKRFRQRWYPAETLSVAIGQGYVAATPLQMAMVAAEIANGGTRYKPQFVKQEEALDGAVVKNFPPIVERRIPLDPVILDIVRSGMCDVVNGVGGTGHAAHLDNITVCGKTGTSQVVKEAGNARVPEDKEPLKYRDHGWFVAYAPSNHPQIAIAAVMEHGGHGGSSAGPVVHDVLQKFFELYPPPGSKPAAPANGAPQVAPNPAPEKPPPGTVAQRGD
ncbi:MAG TPA: penicillin-binding protein 2 [Candidatus Binataceae bacterium]|nr:penicillin-binding protein 2 [Candidatus Binataceae bacterium]